MANNIELEVMSGQSGAYKAGTIMATIQNADNSHSQRVVIDGMLSSTDPLIVETANDGYKSAVNSTPAGGSAIAGGATWSGAADSPLNYGGVRIIVLSTQASATNGLKVYCSDNGVDWALDDEYTIPANKVKTFAATVSPYIKVTYTNGATPATLRVCTLFLKHMSVVSSHRIQDNLFDDDDGQLTVSVLKLRTASNNYVSGTATNAGNFKVSLEEIETGVVVPTVPSDSLYMSEFAELRVANPGNRADVEFIYDKQPLLMDDISAGGGSAVHQANGRDLLLSVVNDQAGTVGGVRQHYWTPYTPGSGQEIDITGTLDAADIGGGTASFFIRSNVTGTVVETDYAQNTWDAATSGVDWATSQIFRMSFQSLKVGRIQFALVRDGLPVKVGEITNDNLRATGYWQYASLPPYWKIYNTADETISEFGYGDDSNGIGFRYKFGSLQSTATARAICETVKSQGGAPLIDMPGFPFSMSNQLTARTVSTTYLPVLSIRVKSTFNSLTNRALVIPQSFSLLTDNPIYYRIIYRPALTGASWADVDTTQSGVEVDVSASALTGGVIIDEDYLTSGIKNQQVVSGGVLGRVLMSLGSTGTSDILTIAAIRTTSSNASVSSVLKWKEIR